MAAAIRSATCANVSASGPDSSYSAPAWSSGASNVAAAIQDENLEVEETYPRFAETARTAGDDAVAARFDEIRGDELEHLRTLETLLEEIEVPA